MSSVQTPPYQRFLRNLRKGREKSGLTQMQVAETLGRSQNYVSRCELGDRRVDVIELWEFARLYGKPLSYFVQGVSQKQ